MKQFACSLKLTFSCVELSVHLLVIAGLGAVACDQHSECYFFGTESQNDTLLASDYYFSVYENTTVGSTIGSVNVVNASIVYLKPRSSKNNLSRNHSGWNTTTEIVATANDTKYVILEPTNNIAGKYKSNESCCQTTTLWKVTLARPLAQLLDKGQQDLQFEVWCNGTASNFGAGNETTTENKTINISSTQPLVQTNFITLHIKIIDVNNHWPQWINAPYAVNVSEFHKAHRFPVFEGIKAVDGDLQHSPLSTVYYSIVNGTNSDYFYMPASDSGRIFLAKPLDYQRGPRHFVLNITASDQAEPPKLNYTTLTITVQDEDDQPPAFNATEYFGSVQELAAVGTKILVVPTLYAYDLDTGINATRRYSISDVCCSQCEETNVTIESLTPTIDPQTGIISVLRLMPALKAFKATKKRPEFYVIVQASQLLENCNINNLRTATTKIHVEITKAAPFPYKINSFPPNSNMTEQDAETDEKNILSPSLALLQQQPTFASKFNANTTSAALSRRRLPTETNLTDIRTGHPYFIYNRAHSKKPLYEWTPNLGVPLFPPYREHVRDSTRSSEIEIPFDMNLDNVQKTNATLQTSHIGAGREPRRQIQAPSSELPREMESANNDNDFVVVLPVSKSVSKSRQQPVSRQHQHLAGRNGTVPLRIVTKLNTTTVTTTTTTNKIPSAMLSTAQSSASSWAWLFDISDARTGLALALTVFACVLLCVVAILRASLTRANRKRRQIRPYGRAPYTSNYSSQNGGRQYVTMAHPNFGPLPTLPIQIILDQQNPIPPTILLTPSIASSSTLHSSATCASLSADYNTPAFDLKLMTTTPKVVEQEAFEMRQACSFENAYVKAAAARRRNLTQAARFLGKTERLRHYRQCLFSRGVAVAPSNNRPCSFQVAATSTNGTTAVPSYNNTSELRRAALSKKFVRRQQSI